MVPLKNFTKVMNLMWKAHHAKRLCNHIEIRKKNLVPTEGKIVMPKLRDAIVWIYWDLIVIMFQIYVRSPSAPPIISPAHFVWMIMRGMTVY